MKPVSIPIRLLGRIAMLETKPTREDLLKEVSEPATISDFMEDTTAAEDMFTEGDGGIQ